MPKLQQFLIYILWNSVKENFRICSVVFLILFCDCWIFVAFCCNNYVLWSHSLACPEACDSLLCFRRFFYKDDYTMCAFMFQWVFFLLQCGDFTVFLVIMNRVQLKPGTQNRMFWMLRCWSFLVYEQNQNSTLKTSHWKNNTPNSHSLHSTTPSI